MRFGVGVSRLLVVVVCVSFLRAAPALADDYQLPEDERAVLGAVKAAGGSCSIRRLRADQLADGEAWNRAGLPKRIVGIDLCDRTVDDELLRKLGKLQYLRWIYGGAGVKDGQVKYLTKLRNLYGLLLDDAAITDAAFEFLTKFPKAPAAFARVFSSGSLSSSTSRGTHGLRCS